MSSHPGSGEIIGRHYATRQPIRLRWKDGLITEVETLDANSGVRPSSGAATSETGTSPGLTNDPTPSDLAAPEDGRTPDLWLAPPLFDLQINGYGGVDFPQDNISRNDLLT